MSPSYPNPRPFEVRVPLIVVLLLILGAGMLFVPRFVPESAAVRARVTPTVTPSPTPVDPFADVEFVPFTSTSGTIRLDRPGAWEAIVNSALGSQAYTFRAPGTIVSVGVAMLPERFIIDRLFQLTGVTTDVTPEALLGLVIQTLPPDQQVKQKVRPLTVGSLTGGALRAEGQETDANGSRVTVVQELWLLELDATHTALILAIAPQEDSDDLQIVLDRMAKSLTIDVDPVIAAIDADFPSETTTEQPIPTATP